MVKRVDQKKVDSILKKIYYNLPNAGAYFGPDKLYRVLKSRGIHNIGKYTVKKWLQNQDDYKIHFVKHLKKLEWSCLVSIINLMPI